MPYKYASTQINLPIIAAHLATQASYKIPDNILSPAIGEGKSNQTGRESQPHITVMYGIHPLALVDQIRDEVAGLPPFRIKFGRLGCFEEVEGGVADCVWVSVADSLGAGGLFALRRRLLKFLHPDLGGRYGLPPKGVETDTGQGGNEEDSEKPQSRKYIPHITLAYVIPGTAKQFVGGECGLTGKEFTVSSIMVSTQSGQQHEVQLMGEGRGKYGPRTLDMVNGYRAWDMKIQKAKELKSKELKESSQSLGTLKPSTQLQPHQIRVAEKLEKSGGVLAYHGMGSGKSLTSIAATIKDNPDVVVPASLRGNFQKEIDKHTNGMKANIMSYEKAVRTWDPKMKMYGLTPPTSKTLVMDEPQAIGHADTDRSMILQKKAELYDKKLLLTGTPIRNRPSEISPLINIVAGKGSLPVDRKAFEDKYVGSIMTKPGWASRVFLGNKPKEIGKTIKNQEEFENIIRGHIDYHMPTQEHFPSHSEEVIQVTMSPEQQKMYDFVDSKLNPALSYKIRKGLPKTKQDLKDMNAFASATRQISNTAKNYGSKESSSPKIQKAVEELKQRHDSDPNFRGLVYSNYLGSGLKPYSDELKKHNIDHHIFDGTMNDKERSKVVNEFNEGKVKALLISGAGAQGLDLKGTKLVQILEPHWNSARTEQAKARAIRYKSHDHLPEEEKHVHVQSFHSVLRPTFTEKVMGKTRSKDMSVDEGFHQMNKEKDDLNNKFLDVLKKVGSEPVE